MDNATFVENWNSIIPHKIKPVELEHPSESFVFRCLISFFRMMKFDVTEFENMYNESKECILMKRTKLVANTNRFYQLSIGSKQSSFLYVDLIKPSPKKTIHVLNILLNFLFYVIMVRDETIERATGLTAKYHELTANINQQKREIENRKIKLSNIEQNISKISHQLPQLEAENEKLQEEKVQLLNKMATIKAADGDFVEKISKLKIEYATLCDQRVDDEEAAGLIRKNEEIEADIQECENKEKTLQLANTEYATLITQIRPCIYVAEEILQNPQDDALRTMQTEVENMRLAYNKLDKEYVNKANILQALQKNCDSIREYLVEKENALKEERNVQKKTERQKLSDLGEQQIELDELLEQNEIYTEQIKVLKDEILLIMQISEQARDFLMRNPVKLDKAVGFAELTE